MLKLQDVPKDVLNRAMETVNKLQSHSANGIGAQSTQDTAEQIVKQNIELKRYAHTHTRKK
jgi:hypothetical protein